MFTIPFILKFCYLTFLQQIAISSKYSSFFLLVLKIYSSHKKHQNHSCPFLYSISSFLSPSLFTLHLPLRKEQAYKRPQQKMTKKETVRKGKTPHAKVEESNPIGVTRQNSLRTRQNSQRCNCQESYKNTNLTSITCTQRI